eukprot:6457468-Amphidinium_carterae.1
MIVPRTGTYATGNVAPQTNKAPKAISARDHKMLQGRCLCTATIKPSMICSPIFTTLAITQDNPHGSKCKGIRRNWHQTVWNPKQERQLLSVSGAVENSAGYRSKDLAQDGLGCYLASNCQETRAAFDWPCLLTIRG